MHSEHLNEPNSKSVDVLLPDNVTVKGTFLLWDNAPEDQRKRRITLRFRDKEISCIDSSYGHALTKIRKELESDGILLRCYGASRNVKASGMSANMGCGHKAYKCCLGKRADQKDLVSIFDSGPDVDPCSINDQNNFNAEWLASIGARTGSHIYPWSKLFASAPFKTLKLLLKAGFKGR